MKTAHVMLASGKHNVKRCTRVRSDFRYACGRNRSLERSRLGRATATAKSINPLFRTEQGTAERGDPRFAGALSRRRERPALATQRCIANVSFLGRLLQNGIGHVGRCGGQRRDRHGESGKVTHLISALVIGAADQISAGARPRIQPGGRPRPVYVLPVEGSRYLIVSSSCLRRCTSPCLPILSPVRSGFATAEEAEACDRWIGAEVEAALRESDAPGLGSFMTR